MTLAAGDKLDSYEVLGLLGAGGMGEVYRARDPVLKREVAIKVLPSFVSQDPDRLHRFEQEAQATAALNHPNILAVHQFGVFEGAPYLVSELLEGGTLRQVLERGPMPVRKAIDYGVQIAHGLEAAHEKSIVHRDLKPENLFVTKGGRIKILDFGLAKLMQPQSGPDGPDPAMTPTMTQKTEPGMVMGTAGYMSPEQVRGKTVDNRTDIFAFGAILYEMLTGKRAFQRSTSVETMTAILNDDPPSISQIVQTTPPGLQRVVHRCLEKNPEQRFYSAHDLAFALEALSDSGSAPAVATAPASRGRWVWAAAALVALAAGFVAWWRIPPAVPVVESVTHLTDDGQPKLWMVSDGSRIYFSQGQRGSMKIAQVSATGGATAPVATPFANSFVVGVKPDGSALLAVVPDSGMIHEGPVWSIPLPAGEPRRLGDARGQDAAYFLDGQIIFGKGPELYVADSDGWNAHKLASVATGMASFPRASPDGKHIIFTRFFPYTSTASLFESASDGTDVRAITNASQEASQCCGTWTLDGKYYIYSTYPSNGTVSGGDICLLPMQTGLFHRPGKPIRLTNGPLSYSSPYQSRDGKQIFVLGTKQRGELVRYDVQSHQFQPFLGGISATDVTFSRDGKWVAYASYPDRTLWRSRSDGSERMQLTNPPMNAGAPSISPDGTKVAFNTCCDKFEVFVISMEGGMPRKVSDNAWIATWSPDGNYLAFRPYPPTGAYQVVDVRTGKKSTIPSSEGLGGYWMAQDTLVTSNQERTSFQTFNLKTQTWSGLGPKDLGNIVYSMISPDGKYLYFATGGAEPKAERIRFADQQVETITDLKGLQRVVMDEESPINVAPDGSPIFTRDTGTQEIYALNIKWP